ncbi:MAG: hypothetical protein R2844_01260 [Caldilineales bacterium]
MRQLRAHLYARQEEARRETYASIATGAAVATGGSGDQQQSDREKNRAVANGHGVAVDDGEGWTQPEECDERKDDAREGQQNNHCGVGEKRQATPEWIGQERSDDADGDGNRLPDELRRL